MQKKKRYVKNVNKLCIDTLSSYGFAREQIHAILDFGDFFFNFRVIYQIKGIEEKILKIWFVRNFFKSYTRFFQLFQ